MASSSLFFIICHLRACNELLSIVRYELLSSPQAAHYSSDKLWWDPFMMVLASTPYILIVALYWVQPGTL